MRLLIVPAHNVFDAIVSTILRLRSSDVHVGESATLSADEQARLLGEAWERAAKPEPLDVRLVVYHRSGRTDSYHLGAHPPSLTAADLDQIHRLWLDVTKAIGPHVHHHDVVRAALRQMEQQLNGPQREEALGVVRQIARLADELAAVLRARDYARLRDMIRNRHAGELAALLTEMSIEDQVVVFRVMPRKDAATVFEYLEHDAKDTLLKAMAQEDVAALLNDMAPDDRTMFLEELPATATRQLLGLLTPKERSVAVTLLGYPEALDRAADDAALRGGSRGLDRPRGARLRPRSRAGQRDPERHLRHRRAGPADRRHPHSGVPAGARRQEGRGPHGQALRRR